MGLFSMVSRSGSHMGRVNRAGKGLAMAALALAAATASHGQAPAQEIDGDPVMDRQLVMQQLDKDSRMMGMILAGIEPKTKLVEVADALARDAKEVRASFQSKTPGGATKPEAWSNWEDFSKRLDDMVTKTEHMAEVAKTGNFNGVTELVADAIPCRSCHTVYRVPKA